MKVAFEFIFPITHPMMVTHTWHNATVMCNELDLTPEQVLKVVRTVITLNRSGSINTILRLTQVLRDLARLPVLIVWESRGWKDLPVKPDALIYINYDDGIINIISNGSRYTNNMYPFKNNDTDWENEFASSLKKVSAKVSAEVSA